MNYSIENAIFAILFAVSIACFKRNKPVSLALFVSGLAGLILPEIGFNQYRPFAHIFAAIICLMTFKGWKPEIIKLDGNEINHAVSYLYCIRVVVDLPRIAGFTGVEITWIISMVFLFMQLLLSLGDGAGYGTTINNHLSRIRRGFNASVFH